MVNTDAFIHHPNKEVTYLSERLPSSQERCTILQEDEAQQGEFFTPAFHVTSSLRVIQM